MRHANLHLHANRTIRSPTSRVVRAPFVRGRAEEGSGLKSRAAPATVTGERSADYVTGSRWEDRRKALIREPGDLPVDGRSAPGGVYRIAARLTRIRAWVLSP